MECTCFFSLLNTVHLNINKWISFLLFFLIFFCSIETGAWQVFSSWLFEFVTAPKRARFIMTEPKKKRVMKIYLQFDYSLMNWTNIILDECAKTTKHQHRIVAGWLRAVCACACVYIAFCCSVFDVCVEPLVTFQMKVIKNLWVVAWSCPTNCVGNFQKIIVTWYGFACVCVCESHDDIFHSKTKKKNHYYV